MIGGGGGVDTVYFFKLAAYFFPVIFAVPLFGTYLASQWLWTFTPSLSYVGQGTLYNRLSFQPAHVFQVSSWAFPPHSA